MGDSFNSLINEEREKERKETISAMILDEVISPEIGAHYLGISVYKMQKIFQSWQRGLTLPDKSERAVEFRSLCPHIRLWREDLHPVTVRVWVSTGKMLRCNEGKNKGLTVGDYLTSFLVSQRREERKELITRMTQDGVIGPEDGVFYLGIPADVILNGYQNWLVDQMRSAL